MRQACRDGLSGAHSSFTADTLHPAFAHRRLFPSLPAWDALSQKHQLRDMHACSLLHKHESDSLASRKMGSRQRKHALTVHALAAAAGPPDTWQEVADSPPAELLLRTPRQKPPAFALGTRSDELAPKRQSRLQSKVQVCFALNITTPNISQSTCTQLQSGGEAGD